jgi:hypothetical protein
VCVSRQPTGLLTARAHARTLAPSNARAHAHTAHRAQTRFQVKLAVELAGLPEPPPQQFGRSGELTNLNPLHLTVSANTELSITISYPQCQQTFTYGYDELASLKAGDTKGPFTFGSVEAFTYSKSNDQECSVADEPYFPYPICLLNRDGWSTREMVESTIDFLALSRQTGLRSAPLPRSIGM